MFWSAFTAPETVSVDPATGNSRYQVADLDIRDYLNAFNALANGPTLPGKVSFDVRWIPNNDSRRWIYNHVAEESEPDSYALDYWDTKATLEWQAETEGGFSFSSYKIGQYPQNRSPGQLFAIAGRERSGRFYEPWTAAGVGALSSPPNQSTARELAATGGSDFRMLGLGALSLGAAALLALRRRVPVGESGSD